MRVRRFRRTAAESALARPCRRGAERATAVGDGKAAARLPLEEKRSGLNLQAHSVRQPLSRGAACRTLLTRIATCSNPRVGAASSK